MSTRAKNDQTSTKKRVPEGYSEELVRLPGRGIAVNVGHWKGRGPSILLLHGLTANHVSLFRPAMALHAAGFNVMAPDLRGRGKSDKPPGEYGFGVHAEDMLHLCESLNLRQVTIVGHSLGATTAIHMATMRRDLIRGIVLVDGGGRISFRYKLKLLRVLRPSLQRLGRVFPSEDAYIEAMRRSGLVHHVDWVLARYIHSELEPVPAGVRVNIPVHVVEAEAQAQGGSLQTGTTLRQLLMHPLRQFRLIRAAANMPYEQLHCPVLILKAARQNLVPGDALLPETALAEMLLRIPNARSETFGDLNHYEIVFADNPRRDQVLIDFIRSLPK